MGKGLKNVKAKRTGGYRYKFRHSVQKLREAPKISARDEQRLVDREVSRTFNSMSFHRGRGGGRFSRSLFVEERIGGMAEVIENLEEKERKDLRLERRKERVKCKGRTLTLLDRGSA